MVAQYIKTHSIMYLCMEADRHPGERVSKRWYEQGSLNLAGAKTEATKAPEAAEEEDGSDTGGRMGQKYGGLIVANNTI